MASRKANEDEEAPLQFLEDAIDGLLAAALAYMLALGKAIADVFRGGPAR